MQVDAVLVPKLMVTVSATESYSATGFWMDMRSQLSGSLGIPLRAGEEGKRRGNSSEWVYARQHDLLPCTGQECLTSEGLLLGRNPLSICTAVGYDLHCVLLGSEAVHIVLDSTLTCKGYRTHRRHRLAQRQQCNGTYT